MSDTKRLTRISIKLASPEEIRKWSKGEVKKPETINYRTQKPEADGLFCEKIFGPTKSWECKCGKYKKIRFKGMICDKCGVEVTKNTVRRTRMGHIQLATPVSHIWYFKGSPSRIATMLGVTPKNLEKVLYYAAYLVISTANDEAEAFLSENNLNNEVNSKDNVIIIDEMTYREAVSKFGKEAFDARMGAEAVKIHLQRINVEEMIVKQREIRASAGNSIQKKAKAAKVLEVLEAFMTSGNKPEWMILDVLPVLPPELRPMVPLDGGRYATSDLNDLYRRVINRNNRLRKLLDLGSPEIIVRNEKRMLQEAVDSLIENGKRGNPVRGSTAATSNRELKSLTDLLKGKQGRFRQNLLGKRVDYSGRSVIIVGPELKMHQCGLPKEMALELFKPFVIKKLVERNEKLNVKTARRQVDSRVPEVWDILEDIVKDHPVLLNRAPTLHRLSIQAFEPILVEGRAIKLHPLVCTAFNADFDGDQMAVHVPLSAEAQAEARFLMMSTNNLLKPQDGKPVTVPSQDMVLGCYYLTMLTEGDKGEGKAFSSIDEAIMAYDEHEITLHSKIKIRVTKEVNGEMKTGLVESSLGRFLFNEVVPQDLNYVNRSVPGNELLLEVDQQVGKSELQKIISQCIAVHGTERTTKFLDAVKSMGYKYSTISGISIGIEDMIIPEIKEKLIAEAESKVDKINMGYNMGVLRNVDRHKEVIRVWEGTTDAITKALMANLDPTNPIKMMADSGARGSANQIKQLAGMRGLMNDTSGNVIEIPIRSNLREGMNVLEFFISSHGARKALSDTALKTADSGYLTRRLVDVAQEVVISEPDCGTDDFTWVKEIVDYQNKKKTVIKPLYDRIYGRYAAADIANLQTGEIIVKNGELITALKAQAIDASVKLAQNEAEEARKAVSEGIKLKKGETEQDRIARAEKAVEDAEAKGKILTVSEIENLGRIKIRSVFDCRSRHGVCAKCYGINLATARPVAAGEAVGIMAAQSIGEPGTQLTMRTFHSGGIASGEDITQGLPRVEEIFEARKPKGEATISEIDGYVKIEDGNKGNKIIKVFPAYEEGVEHEPLLDKKGKVVDCLTYELKLHDTITVIEGQFVEAGDKLTSGPVNPNDILKVKDKRGVQKYIINEVSKVYKQGGGVSINDKHIEIITRQIMRRRAIDDPGDTGFMTNTTVDDMDFNARNEECEKAGLKPATGNLKLMGVTRTALATDSFLSAASFQETSKVLTDAAIKGKVDHLIGLKENVIIGSLIPAGTGLAVHRNLSAVPVVRSNAEILTGHKYGEDESDAALFENEYLEQVEDENAKADVLDAEATAKQLAKESAKK